MKNSVRCELNDVLQERFADLWERCLRDGIAAPSQHPWHELCVHYSEPHRFYHTIDHIAFCLQQFDQITCYLENPDEIEMALWFHDVIHNPDKDNEKQSRELFAQLGVGCLNESFIHNVGELIMTTTHKCAPDLTDAAYICDIDLSSLGAPWEIFLSDSRALRMEQSHYSDEWFYQAKLCFLKSLMARPNIFYTRYFQSKFEKMARHNIQQYISRIEQEYLSYHP